MGYAHANFDVFSSIFKKLCLDLHSPLGDMLVLVDSIAKCKIMKKKNVE